MLQDFSKEKKWYYANFDYGINNSRISTAKKDKRCVLIRLSPKAHTFFETLLNT
jgi:hypothetical protein